MEIFLYDVESEYKVFDYEVDLDTMLDEFYELSDEEGSFFGIKNKSNKVIQFARISEDKWLVDMPIEPVKLSLQRYASYDECVNILNEAYQGKEFTEIKGLYQVPIMETTLDELIKDKSTLS